MPVSVLAATEPASSPLGLIVPIVLMIGVFYFLLIRPQQKRMRAQKEMLGEVGVNDEILTIGGIYGTVRQIDEDADEMILEIAPGTTIRITRAAIARRVTEDEEAWDEDEDDDTAGFPDALDEGDDEEATEEK